MTKADRVLQAILIFGPEHLNMSELAELHDKLLVGASTGAVVDAKSEGPAELALMALRTWPRLAEWVRQSGVQG